MKLRMTVLATALVVGLCTTSSTVASAADVADNLTQPTGEDLFKGIVGDDSLFTEGRDTRSAAARKDPGSLIFHEWRDASNKRILLRIGTYKYTGKWKNKGFGWVKIVAKHRIFSPLTVKFVTKAPGGGRREGVDYVYDAWANRKLCVRNSCEYTDSVKVRAVVSWSSPTSYYGVRLDGGAIGVKTTYCMNANKAWECPPWVDLALGTAKSTTGGQSQTTATEWSYAPLMKRGRTT